MSHIKDLIVNGVTRVLGKLIANRMFTDSITAITASNRDANKCFNTNGAIHRLAFIPGTGTNSAKLNGSTSVASSSYTVAEGDNTTASGYASHTEGSGTVGYGFVSHAEGHTTKAFGVYSHTEGYGTNTGSESEGSIGQAAHAEGWETYAHGNYSHTEGYKTSAGSGFVGLGEAAHAEGNSTYASGTASHAEGYNTYASDYAHSEGYNTNAQADYSHTEGKDTAAYGPYSHAEGLSTIAGDVAQQGKVYAAHAEGENTTASGNYSHAEGRGSTASGIASHAGGLYTIANVQQVTAIGRYNSTCSDGDLFVVGNGTDDNTRKTVFKVSDSGSSINGGGNAIVTVTGRVNANQGFFQTSDINKKNIIGELDLDKAYDLIDKCQTILYTLKDDDSNKEQIGLIAQEVKDFFPELITEDNDGSLSLDYSRLSVVILKVLKDVINRIKILESK